MQTRLPGIFFETIRKAPPTALPRMDIACFVGFSSTGPLNTPVLVEDIRRYRDVFGEDLPLVWDEQRGTTRMAFLGLSVEAFFRNGGQRCWVIRVAGQIDRDEEPGKMYPRPNHFLLPHVLTPDTCRPVTIAARCMGAWSDTLRVGTLLRRLPLSLLSMASDEGGYQLSVSLGSQPVVVGDLLYLFFGDSGLRHLLLLTVETVATTAQAQELRATGRWYHSPDSTFAAEVSAVVLKSTTSADDVILYDGTAPSAQLQVGRDAASTLSFQVTDIPDLAPTDVLELTLDTADAERVLFPVRGTIIEGDAGDSSLTLVITGGSILIERPPSDVPVVLGTWPGAILERWTFAIQVWREQHIIATLDNLGFNRPHPRWWGQLIDDNTLYAPTEGRSYREPLTTLQAETAEPRFPLAVEQAPDQLIPVGMLLNSDPDQAVLPFTDTSPETRLKREGLETFSVDMFLDSRVSGGGSANTVRKEVEHLYYVADGPENPDVDHPLLFGFYSILPEKDVTLIALPDAVHRAWGMPEAGIQLDLLPAPDPIVVESDSGEGYLVRWGEVAGSEGYELQTADDPTFANPTTFTRGGQEYYHFAMPDCYLRRYYRVRALRGSESSPWSVTATELLPPVDFKSDGDVMLVAPQISRFPSDTEAAIAAIEWSRVDGVTSYEVEQAQTPLFYDATSTTLTREGAETTLQWDVSLSDDGVYYFRVRAVQDELVSPWSNTLVEARFYTRSYQLQASSEAALADLQRLQRALLHFCASQGRMFAILGLPDDVEEADATRHLVALRTGIREAPVTSYGAIYAPWVIETSLDQVRGTVYCPPHGAICGLMASRSLRWGAWISPANQALQGIVGTDPVIDRASWARLVAYGINVIFSDPRGYITLSELTLSDDPQHRYSHVRRLLILVRLLAEREGARLVFEPNSQAFRRLVQHRFEGVLATLYARGALAGDTPAEGYSVDTSSAINTPQSVEQGRFIAELRIVPAHASAFITVRLFQLGERGITVEEI